MSGEGELDDKEKGCVLAAMEQVVFPPPPPPPASIHALRHVSMYGDTAYSDMEMEVDVEGEGDADVDIDVVGEDGLSPAATRLALPTPRIPISAASGLVSGSSSSAAPSSSAPRTSSSAASSSRVPSSSVSASGSTSTSATALKKKPKRLAGPGVPPPSPEAPTGVSAYTQHALVQPALHLAPRAAYTQTKPAVHAPNGHPQTSQNGQRWGPLIGAVRGVRAAEAEWGSGGWGGVVLADGYADEDASMRGANPHASTNGGNARASSSSKPYAVVERAGGWDISHSREREEGEDGDVDVVGDGDDTHPSARSRGKSRHQDQQYDRDAAREGTCPPKMRRRWTQGTRGTDPPRTMDKDKGKARVEAMDIGEVTDAGLPPSLARTHGHTYAVASAQSQVPQPAPAPPSPVPPPAASLPALPLSPGTSPSASFARLSLVSPHPGAGGPRPAWVAGVSIRGWEVERAGVVDVEPSGAGADAAIQRQDDTVPPPPADEGTPSHPLPPVADGMPPPGAPLPPSPVAARPSPSPRVRFIEPSPPPEADPSNSPSHEHDDDDVPFMDVPADEPYRPSPASPSPAPESEDEMEEEPAPTIAPVLPVLEVSFSREEASAPVERGASAPIETASLQREASAPAETPMEREMSVAVGDASSAPAADVSPVDVVLDIPSPPPPTPPSPAPPPPVQVKKSIKEWRKEREANKALEDERQRERERERRETESEREREREPEKEKDEQGADKENEVVPPLPPAKPEDALARVLDDIRRDAMSEKPQPPPVHTQVQEDVEMPDTAPPMPLLPPPTATKPRLKMEPFVPTGTHGGLSPLTTSSAAGSRTPSPGLANGASLVKRETSPLAVNVPAMLNGESRPTTSSSSLKPQSSFVKTTALLPPRQHVLQSPKAPRYPSPSFTSNGVSKAAPPPPPKPLPVSAQTSSPSFATNGGYRPTKPSSFSPAQSSPASQWASSSNGIARSPFSPRPATPTFKHHARIPPSVPPTQPRSYQAQRAPPSAPKALREAQNPNAIASSSSSGGSGGGGRGGRFGGLAPQTIPQSVLEPPRERSNRRGHHNRKRR
ncbi:hypothetical protein B0H15DRAFT_84283 [Mycena belliarum]|uniref:Uncharacterized protein n=1 Tax=Mycena belliarum TaxID=1033014 RepID=A0AAD6TPB9_9AGAR|nr:hypothetical protein B0H15DRAFT_84283 [Mycena belliae]